MLETLASGYGLLEGPRVDAADNLYFSDIPNGGVYCRSPKGEVTTVVPRRRGVGGIALHADGEWSSPARISVMSKTARRVFFSNGMIFPASTTSSLIVQAVSTPVRCGLIPLRKEHARRVSCGASRVRAKSWRCTECRADQRYWVLAGWEDHLPC